MCSQYLNIILALPLPGVVLWRCYPSTNTRFGIGEDQNPSHFYTYGWLPWDDMVTARQHLPPEFQIPMTRWEWCIFLWDCPLLDSGVPSSFPAVVR